MGKKLTVEEIEEHSKDVYQAFDICSKCNEIELEGEMNSVSDTTDDLICNECKNKKMSWHPNSNKHKANHRGYKSRPAKKEVLALLDLYNVTNQMAKVNAVRQEEGAQLKLEL